MPQKSPRKNVKTFFSFISSKQKYKQGNRKFDEELWIPGDDRERFELRVFLLFEERKKEVRKETTKKC